MIAKGDRGRSWFTARACLPTLRRSVHRVARSERPLHDVDGFFTAKLNSRTAAPVGSDIPSMCQADAGRRRTAARLRSLRGRGDDPEPCADATKRSDGRFDVRCGVGRRKLHANTRLAFGHDWIGKPYYVYAFRKKIGRHALRQFGVAEHDGNDGVNSFLYRESTLPHLVAKRACIVH